MSGVPGDIPPVPAPLPGHVAQVISLDRKRQTGPEPEPPTDPRRLELAVWLSSLFRKEGLSLADRDTAAALRIALGAASVLVDGAFELGHLEQSPEAVHVHLQSLLQELRYAPDLL